MDSARCKLSLLVGAATLTLLVGLAPEAGAQFYGYSFLQTSNYSVTGATVGAVSANTSSSAALLGSPSGSAAQVGTFDALQSYAGPVAGKPPENTFTAKGLTTPDYARGDVLVTSSLGTNSVAEGFLDLGANAAASGAWAALFPVTLSSRGSMTLTFSFSEMLRVAHPGTSPGSVTADLSWNFSIEDDAGSILFTSSPNAVNVSLSAILAGSDISKPGAGTISITTNTLNSGTYLATVTGANHVFMSNPKGIVIAAVPEPGPIALLSGLLVSGSLVLRRRTGRR